MAPSASSRELATSFVDSIGLDVVPSSCYWRADFGNEDSHPTSRIARARALPRPSGESARPFRFGRSGSKGDAANNRPSRTRRPPHRLIVRCRAKLNLLFRFQLNVDPGRPNRRPCCCVLARDRGLGSSASCRSRRRGLERTSGTSRRGLCSGRRGL